MIRRKEQDAENSADAIFHCRIYDSFNVNTVSLIQIHSFFAEADQAVPNCSMRVELEIHVVGHGF